MTDDSDDTKKIKIIVATETEPIKEAIAKLEGKIGLLDHISENIKDMNAVVISMQNTIVTFVKDHSNDAWKIIGSMIGIASVLIAIIGISVTIWLALRK